jgi:hypothetical protein
MTTQSVSPENVIQSDIAVPIGRLPMSVPEVMGDELLQGLRLHAAGLLSALTKDRTVRRDHPNLLPDVESLAKRVDSFARSILLSVADSAGMPEPGESLSSGANVPTHGDYRVMGSGCWVWMRSLDGKGLPVLGRWTERRHNRPTVLYWSLLNGPVPDGLVLARSCGERLCIAPGHGELVTREVLAARSHKSALDWEAVSDIRARLTVSAATVEELAERYEISVGTVKDIFRGKTWRDPDYEPGAERTCAACSTTFKTTNTTRRYCSGDCARSVFAERQRQRRSECEPTRREVRDGQRRQREFDEARAEFEPHLDREVRNTWGHSLDAVLGETRSTLHDILADTDADDPLAVIEAKYTREVLGDLTEEDIATLSDDEVLDIQERLEAAGVAPSTSAAVT